MSQPNEINFHFDADEPAAWIATTDTGITTQGGTIDEAIRMLKDAVVEMGETLPAGPVMPIAD